jgi:hypothetical protein
MEHVLNTYGYAAISLAALVAAVRILFPSASTVVARHRLVDLRVGRDGAA